jgi:TonB family protein
MPRTPGFILLLLAAMTPICLASTDQPDSVLAKAVKLSSLMGHGAQPFHLKLTVSEPANPKSPYSATVEEYWKSSKDWYRSISAPEFQQIVVVKDGQRTEQNVGGYYPIWLRSFVIAATDPLEDSSFWEKVSAKVVIATSTDGHPSSTCARAQFKVGTAALNNDAFAVICFNADGTLSSVVRPGYDMEFHDAQTFGKKRIAIRYVDDPEPGTELVGKVEVLDKVDPSDRIPDLSQSSAQASGQIKSVPIGQDTFEKLLKSPINIVWPRVHSGNTTGKLSMYVSADRDGQIREAYPLNSDNAGLQDAVRDQLLKLQLRPGVVDGQQVQIESALTFQFSTTLDSSSESPVSDSVPQVPSAAKPIVVGKSIMNAMHLKVYAPVYPQDLKEHRVSGNVDLTAIIGRDGRVVSLTPLSSPNPKFTQAAIAAVKQWTYKPYLLNGSPVEIQTVITVVFQAP